MIREILRGRTEAELAQARAALAGMFEAPTSESARRQRVALIGLRGAGKSTLGQMLADYWMVPFIELSRQIEVDCRVQHRRNPLAVRAKRLSPLRTPGAGRHDPALSESVIATPGGIVSDPATFNLLLSHCYSVWVKASPEDHMGAWWRRATCGRCRATARRWMISNRSSPAAPSFIRRPT